MKDNWECGPLRVFLADEDIEVRRALRLVLQQRLGFQVVGEAAHTFAMVSLVESAEADLVLIEWHLPGQVDARLLASLHALDRRPRVVVLSSQPELEGPALAAGADAFVSKTDPPQRMLRVLRRRAASGTVEWDREEER